MRVYAAIVLLLVVAALAGYFAGVSLSGEHAITTTVYETSVVTRYAKPGTLTVVETVVETLVETKTVTKTVLHEEHVVIDALGRRVVIEKPPARVASLSPAATEILWTLGVLDKLVAVDNTSNYPPVVVEWKRSGRVVDVGGYWWSTLNLEKLVEAKPDLVIAEVGAHAKILRKLEELGLRVVYIHGGGARSLEDVYRDIMIVGEALGVPGRAQAVVEMIKSRLEDLESMLSSINASSIPTLVVLWWSPSGIWSSGGDTFLADLVRVAGGSLVTARYSGWVQLGLEEIAALKPRVIIYTGMSGATREETLKVLEKMASSEPFHSLLEQGARLCGVYGEAVDEVLRPGPRLWKGAYILAEILHPELNLAGVNATFVCLGGAS